MSRSRSNSRSNSRESSRSRNNDGPASTEVSATPVASNNNNNNNADKKVYRVYASGFPPGTVEQEVRDLFAACGTLDEFMFRVKSEGLFVFMAFSDPQSYQSALALNGQAFKGAALVVEERKMKTCFYCKVDGHLAKMCPHRPQDSRNNRDRRGGGFGDRSRANNGRGGDNACFNCGKPGHMSRNCPNRAGNNNVSNNNGGRDGGRKRDRDDSRDRRRSRSRSRRDRSRRRDDSRRRRDDSRDRRRRDDSRDDRRDRRREDRRENRDRRD